MQNLTVGFQLDKRRVTKKGYPLKLRLTYYRQPRYFDTGIHLTIDEYQKLNNINSRGKLKEVRNKMEAIEKKAHSIIDRLGSNFTFEIFKDNYFNKPTSNDVIGLFRETIEQLKIENRIGSSKSYQSALDSFIKYKGKGRIISFLDITPMWLMKYQNYMVNGGKSLTTVGMYTRSLRAIFNKAIDRKVVDSERYPFGRGGYKIPASRNVKKALTIKEVELILNFVPKPDTWEETAKDLWIFSYLCNGANIKDICRLRHKNVKEDSIHFIRSKTERTTVNNQRTIIVPMNPLLKEILNRHSTKNLNPEAYLFPFLVKSRDSEQEHAITKLVTRNINKWIGRIGSKLGIESKITTYTARHTFATVLKRGGAPTEFISESLGHQNLKTTESYLDSFENETRVKYAELLTDFDKNKEA